MKFIEIQQLTKHYDGRYSIDENTKDIINVDNITRITHSCKDGLFLALIYLSDGHQLLINKPEYLYVIDIIKDLIIKKDK